MTIKTGEYKLVIYDNGYQETFDSNGKKIHSKTSSGLESWREYDTNGKLIHFKNSDGLESWREYDSNGNLIHYKDSYGFEEWYEFDANGNMIHIKDSDGFEEWHDSDGKEITKEQFDAIHSPCLDKVIEIEGKKFKLTAI